MSGIEAAGQLIEVGRRLAEAGLVRGSEGNLSIRLDDSRCLVTVAGSELGNLTPSELVEAEIESSSLPPRATSELRLHLGIYSNRPDLAAVVHAHPPRLLYLDAQGKLPLWRRLEDRGRKLGSVVAVEYHAEGTEALARATASALRIAKACVLREHGAVTVGPTLMAAFVRMLDLERAACLSDSRG